MRAFSHSAVVNVDGIASSFNARVNAVEKYGSLYSCTFEWAEAGLFRRFTGRYSETLYRRVCRFIRLQMWRKGVQLLDDGGNPVEFMPPVRFAAGRNQGGLNAHPEPVFFFEPVQFDAHVRYDSDVVEPLIIRIGSPHPIAGDWKRYGCSCYCSLFGEAAAVSGSTTDEAYAWAFLLVRRVLQKRSATLVDADGNPIPVTAPLPEE
jgi:hypothetical protein